MRAMASTAVSNKWLGRFLNGIERVGNRLPEPLILFMLMAALVPVASAIAAWAGWTQIHPATGETLTPVNLLEAEGIRRMLTEAVKVFAAFPPLGIVLVAMLGIGLAERSGFIAACMKSFTAIAPRRLIAPALVFAGILSSIAADAGYVVLIPMGAVLFASVGRHPVAGLCAGFAGVSGGFSANLVITSLDPLLAGFTDAAAKLYDPAYEVKPTANYYFMFVSTFLITLAGWWVTERVVEPRLGPWRGGGAETVEEQSPVERRALRAALAAGFLVVLGCLFLVVPGNAILRDPDPAAADPLKPFYDALIPLLCLVFAAAGLAYGWVIRNVRSGADLARMLGDTMAGMGSYIVLAFFAAQFVAWFQWSNLGLMIAVSGADLLRTAGIGSLPLLFAVILLTATVNLFIGSASAKWGLMAFVLVPMMMSLGYTPELAQAAYRVGDSCTNVITPLLPYFPVILAFARRYVPDMQIGTLISNMLPYSIAFSISWSLLLAAWFLLGLPLGPGAELLLPVEK